jgi:cytochrome c
MWRLLTALVGAMFLQVAGWAQVPTASAQDRYPGAGRDATAQEVAAWDIDVRPDFKGLPPGKGSVAQGQDVWEAKCAHCHGIFGESNEVFSPLIGGTTAEDV